MARNLLSITPPPSDSDIQIKKQTLLLLFSRVVLLTMLLGINTLLQSKERAIIIPPLHYITYFIAAVYLFTIISAMQIRHVTRFRQFAFLQLLTDTALVTCLVFFSGSSQSIFVSIYFFPIIAGSFVLLRRGGLALAATSTLGYGTILFFEQIGYYPQFYADFWFRPIANYLVLMNYFSIHGLTFFAAAILSTLLAERLQRTEKALSQTTLKLDQLSLLYKQIFDDITTGIITVDNNDTITSFNRESEKISGYRAHEVVGRNIQKIFANIELHDQDKMRPIVEISGKDGSNTPVGYSCTKLNMPGDCRDCRVITLQNLSEIKQMEEQVRQAEKMATIGEMTASIAHEFRNPLTAISGSAEIFLHDLDENSTQYGLMKIILRECNRLEDSIADFLEFAKPATPEKEWLVISKAIDEVVQLLKQANIYHPNYTLIMDIEEKMACWCDPQHLHQLLNNLLHNSCTAMRGNEAGEIRITAKEETAADGLDYTILTVADTGEGIPAANMNRIFEPFFTTRDNGTGLGLAIVDKIVASHDGKIKVASRPGELTTFEVSLPLP